MRSCLTPAIKSAKFIALTGCIIFLAETLEKEAYA